MALNLLDYEVLLRLSCFSGVLLIMVALETIWPRRARRFDRLIRWPANLTIALLNTLLVRIFFPTAAVGFALLMEQTGVGLLHNLPIPFWISIVLSVTLLDLTIYVQHLLFHRIPLLWRVHRMHHTDLDIDVSTGARFHPIEILLSMLIKLLVIACLGAPAIAVLVFEILLNGLAMFNHANLKIPGSLDRLLRKLIVTPDMHRVHHSIRPAETNSNFGFNLSLWDRLFSTYIGAPVDGHDAMTIGLPEYQEAKELRLDRMLTNPFGNGE